MTQHYIGFNRGVPGFKATDFTIGTSTGSTDIEIRFDDSKGLTRFDLIKFAKAIERYFSTNSLPAGTPPDL